MMGYSMGTTQIFSALANEYDFYRDKVYKVIQQAPCTITNESMYKGFNLATVKGIKALGIYDIGGPDWYLVQGKLRKFLGQKGIQAILMGGWGTRLINVAVKAFDHYA
mmetsp:Transcript_74104/g.102923  ORF Transcript_74104/g.102923 Transcript_74104/m.102923 type:complete len:108 (-) Transcript_74104:31-354(-)